MDSIKTILLIDDDHISNFITEKLILREEFATKVINFLDAEDALTYLQGAIQGEAVFPEIIFLDLNMPGMNGFEFLDFYKQLPEKNLAACRLYMLSSAVDAQDIILAKNMELVEDFISKPLTKVDMDVITERYINSE